MRGNWANEGKVLLLWDGQVYNEPLYTSLQFDRFPVDQIELVDIIKGPGSVIYGGYAELAVINIKTRSPKNLNGSEAYAAYGQARARARDYASCSFGKVLDGGAEVSAKAFREEAQRSDRRYTDLKGNSYGLNGNSDLDPRSLNLSVKKSGLSLRLIRDEFSLRQADWSGDLDVVRSSAPGIGAEPIRFNSTFAEAKYDWNLSDTLRLEPRFNSVHAVPWQEKDSYDVYEKTADRLTGRLTAFYDPAGSASFVAGGEYYHDSAELAQKTVDFSGNYYTSGNGSRKARYDNTAFFGQGTVDAGLAKLTAGGRYDYHSQTGASFVPRLAATRLWNDFNFKAIYSQSFREPSIENIRLNPAIKAEKTTTAEFETGYKAGEEFYFSGNVFRTIVKDPIIYQYDAATDIGTYGNFDRTGTEGFGVGAKYKKEALLAELGYLYYAPYSNRAATYSVPGHTEYMLGLPKNKVTLNASLPAGKGFSVNPSAVYVSRRYAYTGAAAPQALRGSVMTSLNLQLKDRPAGLTLNLGVRDLFNSNYSYAQPYTGAHAPLPAESREVFFKAGYEF